MKIITSAISEIDPVLVLSNSDKADLIKAMEICAKARALTTTSVDDDSIWADAELSLRAVIDEFIDI